MIGQQRTNRQQALLELLENCGYAFTPQQVDTLAHSPAACYSTLRSIYERQFRKAAASAGTQSDLNKADRLAARPRAAERLFHRMHRLKSVVGRGVFDALLHFEVAQFHALQNSMLHVLRVAPVYNVNAPDAATVEAHALTLHLIPAANTPVWASNSIGGCLANLTITGPIWLMMGAAPLERTNHDTTASLWLRRIAYEASILIFLIISLCTFAMAGATICRRAALQLAGKPHDLSSLWRFTHQKLRTFLMTPLLPFLTILLTGLVLAVLAIPGAIPIVGDLYVGLFFWLFLGGGFIIMLMVLGLIGGFTLMYPTVAIENSDAFDAISRSFSYVYASPWRVLFYGLLAMAYGIITNLFLCFALLILLSAAHTCLGIGMSWIFNTRAWYGGDSNLNAIWPAPSWHHLVNAPNWWAMNWSEFLAAQGIYFWLYLAVSLIGAYTIAYFFCSNVIIYLLLRRNLDGQSLDEVAVPVVATTSGSTDTADDGRKLSASDGAAQSSK